MRYLIFLLVVALIGGCFSSPRYISDHADWVPHQGFFGFTKRSDAQLIVVRDDASEGRCPIKIAIDDTPAAEMEPGKAVRFGLTMGIHWLSAQPIGGCGAKWIRTTELAVKHGDALIVKIDRRSINRIVI
ncbi:hypothetical protein [Pseudomonas yamanorum]|uniref:hypothetical protein n=1 Tax=Pseudomonas yamanorum TaxID=515393 RepID=UPI003D3680DE